MIRRVYAHFLNCLFNGAHENEVLKDFVGTEYVK